jgi:regulator of nucleoside diphosphate kinase
MRTAPNNCFEHRPPIVLTASDRDMLLKIVRSAAKAMDSNLASFLREEIDRADIAPEDISSTLVVRMGCDVTFIDHDELRIQHAHLAVPGENQSRRSVSIFSSIGIALIGLGPGQTIRWVHQGRARSLAVLDVQNSERGPDPTE